MEVWEVSRFVCSQQEDGDCVSLADTIERLKECHPRVTHIVLPGIQTTLETDAEYDRIGRLAYVLLQHGRSKKGEVLVPLHCDCRTGTVDVKDLCKLSVFFENAGRAKIRGLYYLSPFDPTSDLPLIARTEEEVEEETDTTRLHLSDASARKLSDAIHPECPMTCVVHMLTANCAEGAYSKDVLYHHLNLRFMKYIDDSPQDTPHDCWHEFRSDGPGEDLTIDTDHFKKIIHYILCKKNGLDHTKDIGWVNSFRLGHWTDTAGIIDKVLAKDMTIMSFLNAVLTSNMK